MADPTSALDAAMEAYQAGDLPNAKRLLTLTVESEPENTEALHMLSVIAYVEGETLLHEQYLTRILSLNSNHVRSLTALSNLLRERGQVGQAIELADRAIKIAPRYANAYNALGLSYGELDDWKIAADCFSTAISLQPQFAPFHVQLGVARERLGLGNEALEAYKNAIGIDPNNPEAHEGLGRVYAQKGRRAQALRCYQKALALRPESVRFLLQVAKLLQFYGRADEALDLVNRALELDPSSAEAHLAYSYLMQDRGDFEAAMAASRRAIELEPVQGKAYLALVSAAKTNESDRPLLESMLKVIGSGAADREENALLHLALGKAYADLQEYEKAISFVDEANRLFIENNGGSSPFDKADFEKFTDRMIATITPEFVRERTDFGCDSDLPIFIIGLPRSGTTLVEQILSCHPQIFPGGELSFWPDLDAEESVANLASNKSRCQAVARAYLQLLEGIGPGSRYVTDKRPDNFCFAGFMHLLFPKARFIHCRRELIDNALSLYLTPFRSHAPFTYSREDIVFYIGQYQRLMVHWRTVIPADLLLDVQYEHVVGDLDSSARRLIQFCDLPWEDACLRPEQNSRLVQTPSNWQTRQGIYRTSVDKWRQYEPWLGALGTLRAQSR